MDFGIVLASLALAPFVARRLSLPIPGFWAVACALAVANWRLTVAGLRWSDLGLRMPDGLLRTIGWVVLLYVSAGFAKVLLVDPLAAAAGWPRENLSRFSKLPGNAALLAGWLLVAWTQAAFGEEMVFRGFLLTRLEILLGHGVSATVSAVTGQALLFGAGHWYLGPRGMTTAAALGLILGAVYVFDGRNLVPLIIVHGLADSLSAIAIYARLVRIT